MTCAVMAVVARFRGLLADLREAAEVWAWARSTLDDIETFEPEECRR